MNSVIFSPQRQHTVLPHSQHRDQAIKLLVAGASGHPSLPRKQGCCIAGSVNFRTTAAYARALCGLVTQRMMRLCLFCQVIYEQVAMLTIYVK